MRKLTNIEILATIERLEATIRQGESGPRASVSAIRQRRKKLVDYKAELAQREGTGPIHGPRVAGHQVGE